MNVQGQYTKTWPYFLLYLCFVSLDSSWSLKRVLVKISKKKLKKEAGVHSGCAMYYTMFVPSPHHSTTPALLDPLHPRVLFLMT